MNAGIVRIQTTDFQTTHETSFKDGLYRKQSKSKSFTKKKKKKFTVVNCKVYNKIKLVDNFVTKSY